MKRPPRFLIPELRSSQRHSRALSEEERVLWESVAKQIKPLRKKSRVKTPETASSGREVGTAKSAAMKKAAVPRAARPTPPPLVPLGRRERSKLLRGRSDIEARLDLHGMTQAHAHRALSVFLQRAHLDGLTFILVITGKGKMGSGTERGVLRRQVPQWLSQPEFRALVVGFEEAHIGHGGEGALYVRIRRARF
jgi:DNA-nicking Smr family endonuclease